MATAEKIATEGARSTRAATRNLAVSDPRTLARIQRLAGLGYRTVPGKLRVLGGALGRDDRTVSEYRSGEKHSPLSHAGAAVFAAVEEMAAEMEKLEAANLVGSFVDAALKITLMLTVYSPFPTPELVKIRTLVYCMETQINGELNDLQMARACGQPVDRDRELQLWVAQATYSERGAALTLILNDRADYLG